MGGVERGLEHTAVSFVPVFVRIGFEAMSRRGAGATCCLAGCERVIRRCGEARQLVWHEESDEWEGITFGIAGAPFVETDAAKTSGAKPRREPCFGRPHALRGFQLLPRFSELLRRYARVTSECAGAPADSAWPSCDDPLRKRPRQLSMDLHCKRLPRL